MARLQLWFVGSTDVLCQAAARMGNEKMLEREGRRRKIAELAGTDEGAAFERLTVATRMRDQNESPVTAPSPVLANIIFAASGVRPREVSTETEETISRDESRI